jgi:hypothetical protein
LFGIADSNCMSYNPTLTLAPAGPGVLVRGGFFGGAGELGSGVFWIDAQSLPSRADLALGFRAAR